MRYRLLSVFVAIAAVLSISAAAPSSAAASGGTTTKATQVYELRPAQHLVHVTVDMTVKNTTPSTTTYEPCIKYLWDPYWGLEPYSTTCPHTTNFYVTDTYMWIEAGARNLKVSADSGSASKSVSSTGSAFNQYHLKFKRTFYGQTRKLHATYDLPSSQPRSIGGIRAGKAYASFCVSGNGPDGGQIRVVLPSGFDVSHTQSEGVSLSESRSGNSVVFTSGTLSDPISAWACFDGINLGGYTYQTVAGPDGRSVVVEGWPEDPAWSLAVAADVRTSLPKLEALVGRSLPGSGPLEIREVTTSGLGEYAGYYSSSTNVAIVGEDYQQPGLVAHELSHAWFNDTNFSSNWLSEGYAGWVGSQNGATACDRLPVYPGTGDPDLEAWKYLGPKATQMDRAIVDYQYDASCWVVASVADRIGADRMTQVVGALLEGTSAYGATGTKSSTPATWRAWLDAVDELGMVPAGEIDLDAVQKQLAEVGVATDRNTLAARSKARAGYHALLDAASTWKAPEAIRAPLTTWDFNTATQGIDAAQRAYSGASAAVQAVPESQALSGPIKVRYEAATTQAQLDAVASLAGQEASSANALSAARAREAGLDPLSRLGLLGTDTSAMYEAAIVALRDADPAAAAAKSAEITGVLDGASLAGLLRLALAGALILALAFIRRSRKRQRRVRLAAIPESIPHLGDSGQTA